jgi:hypothetical protein
MSSEQPIATREFENRDGPVLMEIYAPTPHGEVGFDCRFIIRWANGKVAEVTAGGADSMQALLLAISAAWVKMLYPKVGQRDESLTFLGHRDLDLSLVEPPKPSSADPTPTGR